MLPSRLASPTTESDDLGRSQACIAEPHCIIEPSDTSDVSASIKIIDFFEVKFAVRSGGHSPNPGWSSIGDQGILFDMHKMNQVNLSSDGKVASVGPGARWGGVMASLDPQRTTVIGGRLPHVGVAGLILGGMLHLQISIPGSNLLQEATSTPRGSSASPQTT